VPGALRDRASHAQTISALPSMRSPDATGPKWLECVGTDGRRSAQTGRLEPARSCPTDRTKHLWGRIAVGRTVPLPTSGRWASEEKRACRVAGLGARLDSHKGDGLRPAAPVHPSGRGHVQGPNVGRAPHTVAPATAGRAAGSRAASRSRRDWRYRPACRRARRRPARAPRSSRAGPGLGKLSTVPRVWSRSTGSCPPPCPRLAGRRSSRR